MQLGDGLRLATSLTVALVAAVASVPLWLLALCALADGGGYGLFRPAEVAAIPHIVPRELIPRAVAANETREFSASLAGPVLGGLLFVGRGCLGRACSPGCAGSSDAPRR